MYSIANAIIKDLNASFQAANIAVCGGIGQQLQDGKVVLKDKNGKFEYIGLTDTKGTGIYFRDANTEQDLNLQNDSACGRYIATHTLFAVIYSDQTQNYTDTALCDLALSVLNGYSPSSALRQYNADITITKYSRDWFEIFTDETLQEPKNQILSLARIQFDLTFSYPCDLQINPC